MLTEDMIRLLGCHIERFPDAPISRAVLDWYSAEYGALQDIEPYEICPPSEENTEPRTIEDVVDLMIGITTNDNRRIARAAIGIMCREARRRLTERTAPGVA